MLYRRANGLKLLMKSRIATIGLMRTLSSCHTNDTELSEVRVRFAPSPTGFMHLGGLRTAFYNYLFAKQNNGCFILRIEDTDQERVVTDSIKNLENALIWAGLKPDEGPSFGGQFGPYLQSQRLDLYKESAMQLLETGHAYRCFCSPVRLDLLRKEAAKNREIIRYDNRCRFLSQKEINEKLSNGVSYTIRLKLKDGPISFDDMVFGELTFNLAAIESDPIIFKSDGYPTYHLANVVDDHYMKITHVLRGAEWQVSTPKHLIMYDAFGWSAPKYAHLPLIMNSDKTKLSKRQKHLQIDHFINNGYFPETILNYLTVLNGGFVNKSCENIDSLETLIQLFDITQLRDHNCKMEIEKINIYNRLSIRTFVKNNQFSKLIEELRVLLQNNNIDSNIDLSDDYLKHLLLWSQDRIHTLNELVNNQKFKFLWKAPELSWDLKKFGTKQNTENILREAIDLVNLRIEDVSNYFKNQYKSIDSSKPMDYSEIMKLLRISLTNSESGPPVAEIMDMLGKERTIQYLSKANEYVNKNFN